MSDGAFGVGFGAVTSLTVVIIGGLMMWGCPQYNVYNARLAGEAEFAKAEQNRQTIVRTATAERDAAKFRAEAEVERARGVAQANKIIGESLKENEAYLRWLWIEGLKEGKDGNTIVYIPTEAGLPILEAERFARQRNGR